MAVKNRTVLNIMVFVDAGGLFKNIIQRRIDIMNDRIDSALGFIKADIVLRNAKYVNVEL